MNLRLLLAFAIVALLTGCQVTPWPARMFNRPDKTTYRTAEMRMDAIREFAAQSTGVDSPDQREIANQLARQIQVEPDPLVREVIVDTIAEFRTPLASQVLEAGLQDEDLGVRRHCCEALGRRRDPAAVPVLARVIQTEEDTDVRLAAVEALGAINSPDALSTLAMVLEDRDPAMQFAGMKSLKAISGKDFGGDVSLWLQYAQGNDPSPTPEEEVSVARRLRELSPF